MLLRSRLVKEDFLQAVVMVRETYPNAFCLPNGRFIFIRPTHTFMGFLPRRR